MALPVSQGRQPGLREQMSPLEIAQLAPSKALNSGSLASALVLLLFSQVPWS